MFEEAEVVFPSFSQGSLNHHLKCSPRWLLRVSSGCFSSTLTKRAVNDDELEVGKGERKETIPGEHPAARILRCARIVFWLSSQVR